MEMILEKYVTLLEQGRDAVDFKRTYEQFHSDIVETNYQNFISHIPSFSDTVRLISSFLVSLQTLFAMTFYNETESIGKAHNNFLSRSVKDLLIWSKAITPKVELGYEGDIYKLPDIQFPFPFVKCLEKFGNYSGVEKQIMMSPIISFVYDIIIETGYAPWVRSEYDLKTGDNVVYMDSTTKEWTTGTIEGEGKTFEFVKINGQSIKKKNVELNTKTKTFIQCTNTFVKVGLTFICQVLVHKLMYGQGVNSAWYAMIPEVFFLLMPSLLKLMYEDKKNVNVYSNSIFTRMGARASHCFHNLSQSLVAPSVCGILCYNNDNIKWCILSSMLLVSGPLQSVVKKTSSNILNGIGNTFTNITNAVSNFWSKKRKNEGGSRYKKSRRRHRQPQTNRTRTTNKKKTTTNKKKTTTNKKKTTTNKKF